MTRDRKREELDRLLAQGRLSGPSRDRILADVLDAQPRRRWPRVALWVSSLSAAAAMLALLVFGRVPPGFRARGGGGGPQLEVGCVQGELAACPTGSTLLFRVTGAVEGGFLVAYAESMDADGGSGRVWYFPTADGAAPELSRRAETQTLRQGILLGPEQPPGTYRVHLLLARRPLSRDEALAPPRDLLRAESLVTLGVSR